MAELSRLAGVSDEDLRRSTIRSIDLGVTDYIGDVPVGGGTMARRRPGAICTRCIREDVEGGVGREMVRPYRRVWWDLRMIDACPKHSILLSLTCPKCQATLGRAPLSPRWCRCGFDLSTSTGTPVAAPDIEATAFLVRRIAEPGGVGSPVLERLSLAGAVTLFLQIGRMQVPGQASTAVFGRDMGPDRRCRICSIGYRAVERWPEGVGAFLAGLSADGGPEKARHIPRLRQWLAARAEPGFRLVEAAMVEHARKVNTILGGGGNPISGTSVGRT